MSDWRNSITRNLITFTSRHIRIVRVISTGLAKYAALMREMVVHTKYFRRRKQRVQMEDVNVERRVASQ